MRRKILGIILVLFFLTAGFVFGQDLSSAEQKVEPSPEPYVQLYGKQWKNYLQPRLIKSFDELGAELYLYVRRDTAGHGGFVEVWYLYLKERKLGKIIAGWLKPYSDEEQGFFRKKNGEWFFTKQKKEIGLELEPDGYEDRVVFYLENREKGIEIWVGEIIIKEFIDKHFPKEERK